ncbi:M13 family metallopeptidase [Mycolicibacterium sp.]|uniref:M13 family metallopeptidase n=1 Tax=Mycolicibacterium sp. TaxID=2320850 RepID=UPI003D1001CB
MTLAPAVKSGIDLSGIDDTVRPGDDFFGWLHGKWLKEHVIPSDRGSDGASWAVQDQISRQLEQLIAELSSSGAAHGTDEQRIADLFASFMDTETIERVGVKPLLDELAGIRSAPTADALAAVLGGMYGVDTGFDTSVEIDSKNPTRYVLALSQAGLGLPDEAYYRDPQYVDILAAYPGHIAAMLALVYGGSADDYAQTAQRIVTLETRLASAHWDAVKNRDPELTYNPRAFSDLAHEAPGFDWDGWLVSFGVTREQVDDIVVKQPDFLTAFAAAWSSEPLQDWKDWATWQTIHARAQLLTEDLVAEDFAFYSKRIAGKEQLAERRERALRVVGQRLGYAVGERYVQKHFPPEAKQRIQELVDNLIAAYRDSITHLEWMTEETRAKALEKLDMMTVKVGYPEQWRDYFGVDIQRDDLYGNVLRATVDLTAQTLAKLGQPVDRSEWDMTPQTVNAYYERSRNEIVFPAGMLQGVFFDPQADDAMNYGGIGAVIGHEIGHAFDDTGSRYDGAGRLVEWWTEADRAAFDVRTKALVEQYNQYVPRQLKDGPHVNGALTLGENIADLGGLAIALQAYQKSLGGKEAPVIDGYTGVQRVLLAYAQSWKEKAVDADMLSQLATDVHSPAEFRVNGVLRNIDAFYEAFGVGESDALYLSPDQRVRIWT